MNPLRELNAAIDAILNLTDPARRNSVRAWLRVVVAAAKMLSTETVMEMFDKRREEGSRDSPTDRG